MLIDIDIIKQQNSIKDKQIKEIVKERKIQQYAPLLIANGKTIWGTEKAIDNLFKRSERCRVKNITSFLWLDIESTSFTLTLNDADVILDQFDERQTALYFQEATDIAAL